MRLAFPTQAQAQELADRICADMGEAGALEPGTLRWDTPKQDMDEVGNPTGTDWYVSVNDRCRAYLTDAEVKAAGFPPVEVSL